MNLADLFPHLNDFIGVAQIVREYLDDFYGRWIMSNEKRDLEELEHTESVDIFTTIDGN